MSFTYKYARPAVTADCVVFGLDEEDLKVLLIQRGLEPFKGRWALPGGFAEVGEAIEDTARRELEEETWFATRAVSVEGETCAECEPAIAPTSTAPSARMPKSRECLMVGQSPSGRGRMC